MTQFYWGICKKDSLQIIKGKGFSKEAPIQAISVAASYALMEMFHFRFMSRKSSYGVFLAEQRGVIDRMNFEHLMQAEGNLWS